MLDIPRRLRLPVLLVVGMRLGCLNHALLTADAIAARGLTLAGWVANRIDPAMVRADDNVAELRAPGCRRRCSPTSRGRRTPIRTDALASSICCRCQGMLPSGAASAPDEACYDFALCSSDVPRCASRCVGRASCRPLPSAFPPTSSTAWSRARNDSLSRRRQRWQVFGGARRGRASGWRWRSRQRARGRCCRTRCWRSACSPAPSRGASAMRRIGNGSSIAGDSVVVEQVAGRQEGAARIQPVLVARRSASSRSGSAGCAAGGVARGRCVVGVRQRAARGGAARGRARAAPADRPALTARRGIGLASSIGDSMVRNEGATKAGARRALARAVTPPDLPRSLPGLRPRRARVEPAAADHADGAADVRPPLVHLLDLRGRSSSSCSG